MMTIEEFDNYRFGAGMKVKYKHCVYDVVTVNFGERLFGLGDDSCEDDEDLTWVRCENAEVIKK